MHLGRRRSEKGRHVHLHVAGRRRARLRGPRREACTQGEGRGEARRGARAGRSRSRPRPGLAAGHRRPRAFLGARAGHGRGARPDDHSGDTAFEAGTRRRASRGGREARRARSLARGRPAPRPRGGRALDPSSRAPAPLGRRREGDRTLAQGSRAGFGGHPRGGRAPRRRAQEPARARRRQAHRPQAIDRRASGAEAVDLGVDGPALDRDRRVGRLVPVAAGDPLAPGSRSGQGEESPPCPPTIPVSTSTVSSPAAASSSIGSRGWEAPC